MENHCINIFPSSAKLAEVKKFLSLLGYMKYSERPLRYYYFERDNYKYHTGVDAEVNRYDESVEVETWIYSESNSFDRDYQVLTIRELKARFGGYFQSDVGRNRFPRITLPTRVGAESGCYLAFSRFQVNLARIKVFLSTRETPNFPPPEQDNRPRDRHPIILSNNLIVPFLVAAMEEFFRSCFVALLQCSRSKRRSFSRARLTADDLIDLSDGVRTVENAYARHLSFQRIDKLCDNFKEIDDRIDLEKLLRKHARRSKESLLTHLH
jgi:hypothetical protein